ncbi:MAG: Si-specific NAD(P)(+) transhydrogenase [Candidatus Dormibacter sp.]
MPTVEDVDFVVIGSGPAGEKAAAHAAYFGKRVALVERSERVGGAPIGTAGVPTKTLRETALYLTGFRRADVYGVGMHLHPERITELARRRNEEVQATMVARVRENLARNRIELVHGTARLGPDRTVLVRPATGGAERILRGEAVLIATGSSALHPPDVPDGAPHILDADSVIDALHSIASVVVVGAGPIGCEHASIFAALGTQVTLIDVADRALGMVDSELATELMAVFSGMGMDVRLGTTMSAVARRDDVLALTLSDGTIVQADRVLLATGRVGNTIGLGFEDAGVAVDHKGRVVVDDSYRTTAPGVFAAGDVIGPPGLAPVSMEQGRPAASHAFGTEYRHATTSAPAIGIYSIPEVGMAGITEKQARERGLDYEVGRARFTGNTRATIAGATEGLVKLIFDRRDRRVLGVHILGETAAEMVHVGQALLQHGGTIDYFVHNTFNVPTWSEAYKYAAFGGLGRVEPRVT